MEDVLKDKCGMILGRYEKDTNTTKDKCGFKLEQGIS